MILPERRLHGIALQMVAGYPMVLTAFQLAKSGKKAFRLIRAGDFTGIDFLVVHAVDLVRGVQTIPRWCLVTITNGAWAHSARQERHPSSFRWRHGYDCTSCWFTLPADNYDSALWAFVFRPPTVSPVFVPIGLADMTAHIATVKFYFFAFATNSAAGALDHQAVSKLVA